MTTTDLVRPLVGLQQLRVQRSFILNWIQTQQTAVMERMRLRGPTDQTAETLQLTEVHKNILIYTTRFEYMQTDVSDFKTLMVGRSADRYTLEELLFSGEP